MTPSSTLHRSRGHARSTSLSSLVSVAPKSLPNLVFPLTILVSIVLASAAQTEVAHHLAINVGYHQPYFTFFLTHITFALVFPLHIILLLITRPEPLSSYLDGLKQIIADQLGSDPVKSTWKDIARPWSNKVTWLTILVSVPALCWFVALNLTTGLSVTTIYATSAFWTYLFSMILLKTPLSRITVGSIGLAFAGVIVLSLDGLEGSDGAPNPLLGDIIMMIGALILGLYEVVYKMALPEGHGGVSVQNPIEGYTSLPTTTDHIPTPPISRPDSPPLPLPRPREHKGPYPPALTSTSDLIPLSKRIDRQTSRTPLLTLNTQTPLSPPDSSPAPQSPVSLPHVIPKLPPALHANFLTSCIGFATLVLLWVPMPLLHWIGWERFQWPGQGGGDASSVWAGLEVVAWGGAIYNAGLMVLIGIWGPTTSSVANLLTIGLVAVIDAVWVGTVPSGQQLVGVGMICVGFGILLWEGEG